MNKSALYELLSKRYAKKSDGDIYMNALSVPCIAEKALIYLFAEVNLITEHQLRSVVDEIKLNKAYIEKTLADNRRPVSLG